MLTLKESGYRGWPYVYTDLNREPVVLVWWASSPTGRQSKYFHAVHFYRKGQDNKSVYYTQYRNKTPEELAEIAKEKHPLPKLKKGYTWHGPYLYL